MLVYKLFRVRKDGTIGPLFINKKQIIEFGKWLPAKAYPTKGFAFRPGWHASIKKSAPHLGKKGRRWYRAEVRDFQRLQRPAAQGGEWVLANWIKVLGPA